MQAATADVVSLTRLSVVQPVMSASGFSRNEMRDFPLQQNQLHLLATEGCHRWVDQHVLR